MTDDTISPLRRRMIEEMTVRGFTACTQRGYIAAVRRFTVFLGRSPDQATAEELRRFQLQMRMEGASATTMNAAVSALRFLFGVTLGRGDAEVGLTTVREPRRLPVVLSPQEVTRLLDAAPGLKYRAALSLALRRSPKPGAHPRFYQLSLRQRGDNPDQRRVWEDQGTLGHGIGRTGEPKIGETVDELAIEAAAGRKPCQLVVVELQVLQIVQNLLGARRYQKVSILHQLSHKELKDRGFKHVLLQVALKHGELVQIGEKGAQLLQRHPRPLRNPASASGILSRSPISRLRCAERGRLIV